MEDRLRRYIDGLFARTAPTRKAVELKEEMIQNMNDKYEDLVSGGKTPEAAYNIVVAGIGDVEGLLTELEEETTPGFDDNRFEVYRRQSALLTAVAVVTYILGVAQWYILRTFGFMYGDRIGVIVFFVLVAGATGLLVYNNMTKPGRYGKSDTIVSEFREWQSGTHDRRSLRKSISAALWSVLLALYFIFSFWTGAWHVTWIMFIIGAAIEAIINLFFSVKK